uniref:Uncharacterized protein n=1 Tax=Oryza meridionalis TaxID=40149 RepID=A0A0E0C6L7_9ORYZ
MESTGERAFGAYSTAANSCRGKGIRSVRLSRVADFLPLCAFCCFRVSSDKMSPKCGASPEHRPE